MAKVKKQNADGGPVVVGDDEDEEETDLVSSDPTEGSEVVKVQLAAAAARPDKMRKIIPNCDGNPIIGGERYDYAKGTEIEVPQHVYELLMDAGRIQTVLS